MGKEKTFCFVINSFNADSVTQHLNLKVYAKYISFQNGSDGASYFDYQG